MFKVINEDTRMTPLNIFRSCSSVSIVEFVTAGWVPQQANVKHSTMETKKHPPEVFYKIRCS